MQQPPNNSTPAFNRTGNGPVSSSASQDLGGPPSESLSGSNGDQYFNATFNAMTIQDFPPFLSGNARSRATMTGTVGKPFTSSSTSDQTADDFAALNLAVGPHNKQAQNGSSEFGPKSPGLPHSSSTSSFASYASMFGQQPTPSTHSTITHTNMYGQSLATMSSNSIPPATMFNPSTPVPAASTQNNITRGSLYVTEPPSIHSSTAASNVSQIGPPSTSVEGLVYSSAVTPNQSPRMSPAGSPLAARRLHSPANQARQPYLTPKSASSNLVQENFGGTTYFYSPEEFKPQSDGPRLTLPALCAYPGMPSHMVHLKMKSSVPQYFAPDELKMDILNRHVLAMMQLDPAAPQAADIPPEVDNYQGLCPLERAGTQKPSLGNLLSTTYKAMCTKDGLHYCLKRIHGFRLANTKVNSIIESWKKLYHPNVVQLKEVFTTKAFNDNSIIFVYDYHSGAETMMSQHFSSQSHANGYSHHQNHHHHHHHHYPRDHGKNNSPRNMNNNLLAEGLIWTYIVQLSSSLRAIHSAGLAVRSLDPNRIILTGKSRLRINSTGILDIIAPDSNSQSNSSSQQDDLTAMGKVILALACNNLMSVQRDAMQSAIDLVQRSYSPDLKNLICYLLTNSNRGRSINDVMPMIGARFFTQLDMAQLRSDVIEHELAKEIENGRLFRIMVKLGSINERPEYNSEPSWAETGDRFMLKLFRDYLFHQVDEAGAAWIDMAHIIQSLNKFDAGIPEKVCLVSRDENSMLVVSYSELKRCFQSCFQELVAQADQSSSYS